MPLRLLALALLFALSLPCRSYSAPTPPPAFGVAAHDAVNIEWWYVNAHVTTDQGRHLALIGSFFRFGTGVSPFDGVSPVPRAHYLIYAVTDLDKKTQRAYSLADANMVALLKQFRAVSGRTEPERQRCKSVFGCAQSWHTAAAASKDRRVSIGRQYAIPNCLRKRQHAGGDQRREYGL